MSPSSADPSADPSDDRLSQEAADWCILMNAPDCSDEDKAAFRRWCEADPAHAAEYHAMQGIWRNAAHIPARPPALRAMPPPPPAAVSPACARRYALAAMLAVAALGLGWAGGWIAGLLPGSIAYYGAGETRRIVTLPDRSRVELNLRSSLFYAGYRDRRSVRLTAGEAYFEVAHDEQQPFTVSTENGTVEVTGTRFNVWTDPQRLVVTLSEGGVTVRTPGWEPVRLVPGQQASYRRDGRTLGVEKVDPSTAAAWRDGKLVLNDLPLDSALPMINRYLDEPLRLGDARLSSLRIGGIYDVAELHRLPDSLTRLFPIRVRRGSGEVVLLGR